MEHGESSTREKPNVLKTLERSVDQREPTFTIRMIERKMMIGTNLFKAAITVFAFSVAAAASATQSDIGECGPGPALGDANSPHDALYSIDGEGRSEGDLPLALQQALFDARLQHYKKQRELIDAAILESELEKRAEQEGKPREQVARELFAVASPDDAAVETFYRRNQARIQQPLEAVRDQIRRVLVQRGVGAKQAEFIARVKSERSFELLLTKPLAPYAEIPTQGFPSKGPSNAKVTIIEFADYQCPHCKQAAASLKRISQNYGADVRVVFLDFPINRSGISRVVAEGGACADKQGSFWAYHDLAFENQGTLSNESANQFASELGLDTEAFRACLQSAFARERIANSEAEARRLGVSSTPTLFLNGRRLHLHNIDTELPIEIDKALAGDVK